MAPRPQGAHLVAHAEREGTPLKPQDVLLAAPAAKGHVAPGLHREDDVRVHGGERHPVGLSPRGVASREGEVPSVQGSFHMITPALTNSSGVQHQLLVELPLGDPVAAIQAARGVEVARARIGGVHRLVHGPLRVVVGERNQSSGDAQLTNHLGPYPPPVVTRLLDKPIRRLEDTKKWSSEKGRPVEVSDQAGQLVARGVALGSLTQQRLADLPHPRPTQRNSSGHPVEDQASELLVVAGELHLLALEARVVERPVDRLQLRDDRVVLRADHGDPVDVGGGDGLVLEVGDHLPVVDEPVVADADGPQHPLDGVLAEKQAPVPPHGEHLQTW